VNIWDIAILLIVGGIAAVGMLRLRKKKGCGCGCCDGCTGCAKGQK